MPGMKVDVSHPGGNALARYLVAAIAAAGYDGRFYTGLYVHDPEKLAILRLLPQGLRALVTKALKRRSHADIAAARVTSFLSIELPHLLASQLGASGPRLARMRQYRDGRFDARVARALRADPPDVFIGHDASSLVSLRTAKALGKVAVLNQVVGFMGKTRDMFEQERAAFPNFATLDTQWWSERRMNDAREEVHEAQHILVPSDYVRDTLVAEGIAPERIVLLPYGVDIERFRPGAVREDGPLRLLFVGQIGIRKGILYVLEALRRLNRSDIELTIVGSIAGSEKGLAPYRDLFRYIPRVVYQEVHRVFQEADAFIFPSLHEGSAFVIFEALASGLPVITTHNSGSVVRDGIEGLIVQPRDIDAIVDSITRLADDRELRRTLGRNARKRAEDYTWGHYRDRLTQFLDTCRNRQ